MGEPEIYLTLGVAAGTYCFFYLHKHYHHQRQLRYGEEAEGEVVDLIPVKNPDYPDDPNLIRYDPLIRFQTRTGATITVRYSYNGSLFSHIKWQTGQCLLLRYLPANPKEISLPAHKESIEDWLITGMMLSAAGVVGTVLVYLAYVRS